MVALCECGCGLPAPIAPRTERKRGYVAGEPRRFVHGHNARRIDHLERLSRTSASRRGELNPNWKGGRYVDVRGYVRVNVGRDHPMANRDGHCWEHRLVMAAYLGRMLRDGEHVHHRDGMENDPENLILFASNADHRRWHWVLTRGGGERAAIKAVTPAAFPALFGRREPVHEWLVPARSLPPLRGRQLAAEATEG